MKFLGFFGGREERRSTEITGGDRGSKLMTEGEGDSGVGGVGDLGGLG